MIEKIVEELYSELTDEDREFLLQEEKSGSDLYGIDLHFTAGRQIRNRYHLWEGGVCGDTHPDDVSAMILHKLICKVKGE